jgi:hypothetical protein
LRELSVNEFLDLGVIKKQVFEIRIEQSQVHSSGPSQERQVSALVRLDDPPWNFAGRHIPLSFGRFVGSSTTENFMFMSGC